MEPQLIFPVGGNLLYAYANHSRLYNPGTGTSGSLHAGTNIRCVHGADSVRTKNLAKAPIRSTESS